MERYLIDEVETSYDVFVSLLNTTLNLQNFLLNKEEVINKFLTDRDGGMLVDWCSGRFTMTFKIIPLRKIQRNIQADRYFARSQREVHEDIMPHKED